MTTIAMEIARERQLDWLLAEVLGEPKHGHADTRSARMPRHWLGAAIALLAVGVAFGVAMLREDDRHHVLPPQEPVEQIEWFECHGIGALDSVPIEVVNLKCFDFDDDAMAKLVRFTRLERLDMSGMDVNAKGYSVSLPITDVGASHLGALTRLRWLSLASCNGLIGSTLNVLEGIPQLGHLDLTYTGIMSPGVEGLTKLPSLRSLSLSHCLSFHGRSLAAIAKIPGLRRLELYGCATVAAKDAMHLAQLSELRHLDLRDCMGRFRGQTAAFFDDVTNAAGEPPPPPPVQDGVGITDEVVTALTKLPLDTLLLAGCSSLTNDIGAALGAMPTLRNLDLGELSKTTGEVLVALPNQLEALSLDGNWNYRPARIRTLARFTNLQELGLTGLEKMTDHDLAVAVGGKRLKTLRIGGAPRLGPGPGAAHRPKLTPTSAKTLAQLTDLESLVLSHSEWINNETFAQIAKLPKLRRLDLSFVSLPDEVFVSLGASRSIEDLVLLSCRRNSIEVLRDLRSLPLKKLDLYAMRIDADKVHEVASAWPGCRIRMPKGQSYVVP